MRLEVIENKNSAVEDARILSLKEHIDEFKRLLRNELSNIQSWEKDGCSCAPDFIRLDLEKEDILMQI